MQDAYMDVGGRKRQEYVFEAKAEGTENTEYEIAFLLCILYALCGNKK